jgi:hypothetical protein
MEPADVAAEVQRIGAHLLELLARPGEPSTETLTACAQLFQLAAEPVLVRWIGCELAGYGGSGAISLKDALGVPDDSALASRVRAYRQYVGRVRTQAAAPAGRQLQVPYFFGEALETLRHYRANADAISVDFIEVEPLPSAQAKSPQTAPSGAPLRTLEFPRYIFYRILSGLGVELEIAVRNTMRKF